MATAWFGRVCDSLLSRIRTWHDRYEQGQIYATRQYLTKQFAKIDVPVQHIHEVPFTLPEMSHLVRMLEAKRPDWKTTEDFRRILGLMRNPMLLKRNEVCK